MGDRLGLILSNFTESRRLIMQMILEEIKIDLNHVHIVDILQVERENKLNILFKEGRKLDKINYPLKLSPNDIQDIKNNTWVNTEKIIFDILRPKLVDLFEYKNLYFTPRFIEVLSEGNKSLINFYLYIDSYETKEI